MDDRTSESVQVEVVLAVMSLCKTTPWAVRLTVGRRLRTLHPQAKRNIHATQNAIDMQNFDVVIVGGGPAGLALASALGALC